MQDPLKSNKNEGSSEINWEIRESFSETALSSFLSELERNLSEMEKKKQ